MKLLFDQNLSHKLCARISDLFPHSDQVQRLGLSQAEDRTIWRHAKTRGFTIVTLDSDFADMAALFGAPPKVIWLRCGNQPTPLIEKILRDHEEVIRTFERDEGAACLEVA
jgi:predicted nuclease of predicted toxin-antitoxin system